MSFNTIKVNNTDTDYTHSIFDISEYNSGAIFKDLSAALAAVPQDKKKGGMSIKFVTPDTPARYSVVKTENLTTEPTGTLLSEAPSVDSGTYDESQLSGIFTTLPSDTGSGNALTYYVAVTVDETTTYTSWVVTKILNSGNKYVQLRYMSSSTAVADFTNAANWQGIDDEPIAGSNNLVKSGGVKPIWASVEQLKDYVIYNKQSILFNAYVLPKPVIKNHFIDVSEKIYKSGDSDFCLINISEYKGKHIRIGAIHGAVGIAFLQDDTLILGEKPNFCEDISVPIVINNNEVRVYTIPNDCVYLYTLVRAGQEVRTPSVMVTNGYPMAITGEYEKNSVYINTLWLDTTNNGHQDRIIVDETFNFGSLGNASEFLVLSENDVVSIKRLSSVLDTDIILLVWGRTENDYYYGALYDQYLYYKTTATENFAKELDGRVNALENGAISPSISDEISGYLNIASPYEFKSNNSDYGGLIDVSNYKGKRLVAKAVNGTTTIAFLQNNTLTLGQVPSYSSDYNRPIVVQSNATVFYTIPSDCNYLYTLVRSGSTNKKPNILIKYGKTTILNLRIGGIALADGKPYVGYNSARIGDIKKLMIADKYLELENGDTIDSISGIDSSETLGYACFDRDFNLIGFNSSVLSGSKYVRLYCAKSENEYTHNSKNIIVSVSRNEDIELNCVKCGSELVTSGIIWFTYPIHNTTYSNDTANTNTYEGDNTEIVLNNGYVILPPNYSRNGNPCPVVVHCHGTGGVTWRKSSMPYITYNQDYLNFIAKNGYIVIGCSTTTELYAQQYRDADIATPLAYSAYVELFRYVIDNFNADANRVSIFGYSSGGIMSNMLARLQPFKINCVASLAGSLDYATNGRVISPVDGDANILGNTLNGIPTENQPGHFSSSGQNKPMDNFMIERFIQYKDNICGLSPLFFGLVGVEIADMMQQMYSIESKSAVYDANQNLQTLVNTGKIVCNAPTKIWHAIDDENVPYAISKYYVQMIHRAGGYAKLRTFPTGCGKHNAVGNSTNTTNVPFMDYVTTFGETINVPVTYGELVDWFNKWSN